MRNAIISSIIFIGMLTTIFFLNKSVLNICDNIKLQTEEIESLIASNDKENSYKRSLELLNYIQDNDLITSVYVTHTDFDTMRYEVSRLCIYISENDKREANASLHVVKFEAETVKHLQKVGIDNIF